MEIVDLTPEQIPAAGSLLARAFSDDGLTKYMYPDDGERATLSPWHFTAVVRYGVLFGRVLATTDPLLGVAVWLPPGEHVMTENRIAAAGLDAAPAVLGEAAFGRFVGAMQAIEPFHAEDVPERHWYLALIGVAPEQSGKGIGGRLMSPVLVDADRDGLMCYLETAHERNVSFYERQGFEMVRNGTAAGTTVDYWTMRRPAQ